MLKRCEEKLIEDLSFMEEDELDFIFTKVQEKREARHKEELAKAFNDFETAWEKLENFGYRAISCEGKEINYIRWNFIP